MAGSPILLLTETKNLTPLVLALLQRIQRIQSQFRKWKKRSIIEELHGYPSGLAWSFHAIIHLAWHLHG
jgi:hypothetical protein